MLLRPVRTIDARELEPLALGARWVVVYRFAARELAFGDCRAQPLP